MTNSFLLLPEKLARYPLTLDEAVQRIGVGSRTAMQRATMPIADRLKLNLYARRSVLVNLMSGELHSFVQDMEIGAWYRIPKQYWCPLDGDIVAAVESPSLPKVLEPRSGCVLPHVGIAGQAIVVWQDDVEKTAEHVRQLGAEMYERDRRAQSSRVVEEAPATIHATSAALVECRTWLELEFRSPSADFPRTKPAIKKLALSKFGGRLSGRSFERAWTDTAPEERRKAGAKPKKLAHPNQFTS